LNAFKLFVQLGTERGPFFSSAVAVASSIGPVSPSTYAPVVDQVSKLSLQEAQSCAEMPKLLASLCRTTFTTLLQKEHTL
jgi:hypothetical protein